MYLVVKSAMDPGGLTSAIRGAVREIDKDQAVFSISTMDQLIVNSVSTRRITLILLGLFSTLALVGVISYSVRNAPMRLGFAWRSARRRPM
jgi:putative ABC transport system permease protein